MWFRWHLPPGCLEVFILVRFTRRGMIIEFRDPNEPTEGLNWKVPLNRQTVYVWEGVEICERPPSKRSATFCISGGGIKTTRLKEIRSTLTLVHGRPSLLLAVIISYDEIVRPSVKLSQLSSTHLCEKHAVRGVCDLVETAENLQHPFGFLPRYPRREKSYLIRFPTANFIVRLNWTGLETQSCSYRSYP